MVAGRPSFPNGRGSPQARRLDEPELIPDSPSAHRSRGRILKSGGRSRGGTPRPVGCCNRRRGSYDDGKDMVGGMDRDGVGRSRLGGLRAARAQEGRTGCAPRGTRPGPPQTLRRRRGRTRRPQGQGRPAGVAGRTDCRRTQAARRGRPRRHAAARRRGRRRRRPAGPGARRRPVARRRRRPQEAGPQDPRRRDVLHGRIRGRRPRDRTRHRRRRDHPRERRDPAARGPAGRGPGCRFEIALPRRG